MDHLGIHCSTKGGLDGVFAQAEELNTQVLQLFTRNQRQWKAKSISPEEAKIFEERWQQSPVQTVVSHTSYLINLASQTEDTRDKSLRALIQEIERCQKLNIPFAVLHPGSRGDQSLPDALQRIIDGLTQVLEATPESKVKILLENTAGQGTSVGGPFENLAHIGNKLPSERIGYCFDTCHAFVQGYDLRSENALKDTLQQWDDEIGLSNIQVFHFNDAKGELGSHLDRHENIGDGQIGDTAFRYLMERFRATPMILETPKKNDGDQRNIAHLRSLPSSSD